MNGRARIMYYNGTVFKGTYNDNYREKGVEIYRNGKLVKGTYKDN